MNYFVNAVMGTLLFLSTLNVILIPIIIGRAKEGHWGYNDYIRGIIGLMMITTVAGRVFGWW